MSGTNTGIRSSKADYVWVLNGISDANTIIKGCRDGIHDKLAALKVEGVMSGETGDEFNKRLEFAVNTVDVVAERFDKLADYVAKTCADNGAFIDRNLADNFDEASKRMIALAGEINAVGKK